jgi:hypothetical protein
MSKPKWEAKRTDWQAKDPSDPKGDNDLQETGSKDPKAADKNPQGNDPKGTQDDKSNLSAGVAAVLEGTSNCTSSSTEDSKIKQLVIIICEFFDCSFVLEMIVS